MSLRPECEIYPATLNREAIGHLSSGLSLLESLPASAARDGLEVEFLSILALARMAVPCSEIQGSRLSDRSPTPALYRVQGFSVALEDRPEGILATVVDAPEVTAIAETRSEVLNLIREQLAPFWKPSELDVLAS